VSSVDEFQALARSCERSEAETLLDALALQLGPIKINPTSLALALDGRVRRNYEQRPGGVFVLDATVTPRSAA